MPRWVLPTCVLIVAPVAVGLRLSNNSVADNTAGNASISVPTNGTSRGQARKARHCRHAAAAGADVSGDTGSSLPSFPLTSAEADSNASQDDSARVTHNMTANLSEPCESFSNKKVVFVQINEEYILRGMFTNWIHHARPFLGEDVQLVVDAVNESLYRRIFEIADLPNSPVIINRALARVTRDDVDWAAEDGAANATADDDSTRNLIFRDREPFGSPAFGALMERRPTIIGSFLKDGCPLLLVDVDTVWKADVFTDIEEAGYHDLYVTDNTCSNVGTSGPTWRFCGCFLYLRPPLGSGDFVHAWLGRTQVMRHNEQFGLNYVLQRRHGTPQAVDFAVLPFSRFPPGCRARKTKNTAHIIHANYYLGIDAKINFFKSLGLWFGDPRP